MEGTVKFLIER